MDNTIHARNIQSNALVAQESDKKAEESRALIQLKLPAEIMQHIFSFIPREAASNPSLVCKEWHALIIPQIRAEEGVLKQSFLQTVINATNHISRPLETGALLAISNDRSLITASNLKEISEMTSTYKRASLVAVATLRGEGYTALQIELNGKSIPPFFKNHVAAVVTAKQGLTAALQGLADPNTVIPHLSRLVALGLMDDAVQAVSSIQNVNLRDAVLTPLCTTLAQLGHFRQAVIFSNMISDGGRQLDSIWAIYDIVRVGSKEAVCIGVDAIRLITNPALQLEALGSTYKVLRQNSRNLVKALAALEFVNDPRLQGIYLTDGAEMLIRLNNVDKALKIVTDADMNPEMLERLLGALPPNHPLTIEIAKLVPAPAITEVLEEDETPIAWDSCTIS